MATSPVFRCFGLRPPPRIRHANANAPAAIPSPPLCSHGFAHIPLKQRKVSSPRPFRHPLNASSKGLPDEFVEDSKFVPLNADDPVYGPPALLLLGFTHDETPKIRQFLKELEGEFLKVIHCTEDMLSLSVWEAMHTEQPNYETVKIAKSLPRMCILSGLSGEEMMMFIDAFPESGLEPAVFAALVPNSAKQASWRSCRRGHG